MKKQIISLVLAIAAGVAPNTIKSALASTTLRAYETADRLLVRPYSGTISLQSGERQSAGARSVTYRITLNSSTCNSTLAGVVTLSARKDDMGDDSAFLRNGDVVKTNIFTGTGTGGAVTIVMDVESKEPRYAGVSVDNASGLAGGCEKAKKFDIEFY